jgi:hypothetical protein
VGPVARLPLPLPGILLEQRINHRTELQKTKQAQYQRDRDNSEL